MKKNILLWAILCLFSIKMSAQNEPQGMNYQAVARNLKGEILANQPISLKVTLFSSKDSVQDESYTEIHSIVTSVTGVFSLVIGNGNIVKGVYDDVPWSKKDIWIQVSIKGKDQSDFSTISNSKLLAVPYAYHAFSADEITNKKTSKLLAKDSENWSLKGNGSTNSTINKIGTTDLVDLIVVTNNVERLRIKSNGDIGVLSNINIGKDFNVDGLSSFKNHVGVQGNFTVNSGAYFRKGLTVENNSATKLTGTLDVHGISNFGNDLNVLNNKATNLTGTLEVAQKTTLKGSLKVDGQAVFKTHVAVQGDLTANSGAYFRKGLTVENNSATNLSGNLDVDGITHLKNTLFVDKELVIDGLTRINNGLVVHNYTPTRLTGSLEVVGVTNLNNDLNVLYNKPSKLSGSLTVDGDTKLKGNLYIDGMMTSNNAAFFNKTLNVSDKTTLSKDLLVGGKTEFLSTLTVLNMSPTSLTGRLSVDQDATLNGSLKVKHNSTFEKALNIGGELTVQNLAPTSLTGTLLVGEKTTLSKDLLVVGKTELLKDLTVQNFASTSLTGTLLVGQDATLNGALKVKHNSNFASNLGIGGDLTVDSNGYFRKGLTVEGNTPTLLTGTLNVGGITDFKTHVAVNGDLTANSGAYFRKGLTVENSSPAKLTGTLDVDGITHLKNTLFVDKELVVDGLSRLNNGLTVHNYTPTLLTGTLNVGGITDFKTHVAVNGDLIANSGAYFRKGLTVENSSPAKLTGTLDVDGITHLKNTLFVDKELVVDGLSRLNNGLTVHNYTPTKLTGTLEVLGKTILNGKVEFKNSLNVSGNGDLPGGYIANFVNETGANGISIKVNETKSGISNKNNFITFLSNDNSEVGRIEGETVPELDGDSDYRLAKEEYDMYLGTSATNVTIATLELTHAIAEQVAAATSSTGCVGLGACVTAPIISLNVVAAAGIILATANLGSVVADKVIAENARDAFIKNRKDEIGVTYQSGAADYAEWLPKSNPSENYLPGYIVGINNGFISKSTDNGSKLFVISTKPIVLGNMPAKGTEEAYEKVAFMGQVPVRVVGKVNMGDYIVPTGLNNGLGKAISPNKMKAKDYSNIVGVAWSSSTNDAYNLINVAIGLNTGDISKVVAEQNDEIEALKSKINDIDKTLEKLLITNKNGTVMNEKEIDSSSKQVQSIQPIESTKSVQSTQTAQNNSSTSSFSFKTIKDGDFEYVMISREQFLTILEMEEKKFVDNGGDVENHVFWKKIKSDAAYKQMTIDTIFNKYTQALKEQRELNNSNITPQ